MLFAVIYMWTVSGTTDITKLMFFDFNSSDFELFGFNISGGIQSILWMAFFASFAAEINKNIILITLPMVLAASCAFMMPISTPPNAIAYSSKKFTIKFMVKTGIYLNIISIIIITLYINFFQTAIFKT